MFRAWFVVGILRRLNRNDRAGAESGSGTTRQILTIRRINTSCRANCRLRQRFLDISFQHSDWSLCNRDAKVFSAREKLEFP